MSLHDIDTVRILVEVVEKDIPLVRIGQKAEVRPEAVGAVFGQLQQAGGVGRPAPDPGVKRVESKLGGQRLGAGTRHHRYHRRLHDLPRQRADWQGR